MNKNRLDDLDETAVILKRSLESTNDGFTKFIASLRQSGLPDAVKGYRQLQVVLMQQRLWAQNHKRQELDSLFQNIARNAEELHAIFAAFADIMEPLKDLPNITDASCGLISEQVTNAEKSEVIKPNLTTEEPVTPLKKSATNAKPIALPAGRKFQVILESLMTQGSLPLKKLAQLANKSPERLQKDIDYLVNAGAVSQTDNRSPRYQLSKKFIRQMLLTPPSS